MGCKKSVNATGAKSRIAGAEIPETGTMAVEYPDYMLVFTISYKAMKYRMFNDQMRSKRSIPLIRGHRLPYGGCTCDVDQPRTWHRGCPTLLLCRRELPSGERLSRIVPCSNPAIIARRQIKSWRG
jgi:hypothetical protein